MPPQYLTNTHLCQGTLMVAKKIVIAEGGCIIVNVIYNKPQLLDLLKSIVHLDWSGKVWVLRVNNCFCAAILSR